MNLVGYGVTRDGHAVGIWPMTLTVATETRARYLERNRDANVHVVPLYAGHPVDPVRARVPTNAPQPPRQSA